MEQPTISRRALLASAPAAAVLATASCTSAPALAAGRTSLTEAIEAYRHAVAGVDAFDDKVYTPALEAWQRAIAAIPYYTTASSYESHGAGRRHMTTAHVPDLAAAKMHEKLKGGEIGEYRACAAELLEAVNRREAEAQRLRARYRIDELYEESNRLCTLSGDAFVDVETFPVTTLAELVRKIEFLEAGDHDPLSHQTLLADLRRIEGRA